MSAVTRPFRWLLIPLAAAYLVGVLWITLLPLPADPRSWCAAHPEVGLALYPLAFVEYIARALGAGSTLVEVQAGWRDRQDLVGHFNAFERRFYESEFLQALYRAQSPRYSGLVNIVVLDEMNLSHPEQYFADLV